MTNNLEFQTFSRGSYLGTSFKGRGRGQTKEERKRNKEGLERDMGKREEGKNEWGSPVH